MTNPTDPHAFDGCNSECRKAGAHTLRWGGCEHAPKPEPTVSMSKIYTDPGDGYPSIGFDSYTVDQLAELLDPVLGFEAVRARRGSVDLAHLAAHAIVHRNDDTAASVPSAPTQTADADRRDRYAAPLYILMRQNGWDGEYTEPVVREMDLVLDAVLAVADAEQAALKRAHVALAEQAGRDQAALGEAQEIARRLAAHAVGFQDVLDDSDRGPWGRTVGADIAALRELLDTPSARAVPSTPTSRAALRELIATALYESGMTEAEAVGPMTDAVLAAVPSLMGAAELEEKLDVDVTRLTGAALTADEAVEEQPEASPFTVQVWPLARILTEVRCGSQDWTWDAEWADLDRRHTATGYLDKLTKDIAANGITMPVLIGTDGRLWDGHHRLRVAVRLGIGYVPVEVPAAAVLPQPDINTPEPVKPTSHTWTFEVCYEGDKWHGCGPTYDSSVFGNAHETAQEDFLHRAENDKQRRRFRMVCGTTTYAVEAEYAPAVVSQPDEEA